MKFDRYPTNVIKHHLAMTIAWAAIVAIAVLKIAGTHYALFAFLTATLFGIYNYLSKEVIFVNKQKNQLEITKYIGKYKYHEKYIDLSKYSGIRNRIHWGNGKHCQTELIDNKGSYFPIRIELSNSKISESAVQFQKEFSQYTGIPEKMELPYA